ncbi:hypothetical protein fugu_001926 [Takifugu bimaculatus]|uniref:C2H2-type domain-containing protein n=1 Tax=Takifugu bimaculatus TaxID=433685 RepID=A0A4Z2BR31_9TELE|nr:hypothetical protein fugu_001926 [Takifugu bimaculatus]
MKRGSSVLPPPSDAAKRLASALTAPRTGDRTLSLSAVEGRAEHAADTAGAQATGPSPFPAATSLFSPDVSTKMASDLLIRLSEATQKSQGLPGEQSDRQRDKTVLDSRGGQQDEPGLALSPDGPGASPEPPSLSNTPDDNAATDTLASEMLRKLAERQEVHSSGVAIKEEEEPVEVNALDVADLIQRQPAANEVTPPSSISSHSRLFSSKTGDQCVKKKAEQCSTRAKTAEQQLHGLKMVDRFYPGGCQAAKTSGSHVAGANTFQFRVKLEDRGDFSGAKMEDQLLFKTNTLEQPLSAAKLSQPFHPGIKMEDQIPPGTKMEDLLSFGPIGENELLPGPKMDEHIISGAKTEEQLLFGAKMEDQCLRAVLWQDMSVNLASTLLHQLSERVSKSSNRLVDRTTPPVRSSPVLKVKAEPLPSSQEAPHETSRDQPTGRSYFYRCHVCGFETDGRGLFQGHMTEHRQWERDSFSLHCCACDHLTNQEAEMRAHVDRHVQGTVAAVEATRYPITLSSATSSSTLSVAVATQPENSTSEHRCRICQRSFPGQQELLVHFQGHRQGNQYRCDRCGHLTRTANKLVEHVRVHTGERPFTCDLCPYSAKRRDSLRLHCKVKHGGDVHTYRSYVHADNQRSNKHVQRLHTPSSAHTAALSPSSIPTFHPALSDRAGWRDLSPLLPITTLISLKPRCPSSATSSSSSSPPASSSSSSKHFFLGYLGLTTSV